MDPENLEAERLRLDQERVALEKARWELERRFWSRHTGPLLGILGAIVAGLFAIAQVWVASIQKSQEIEAAQLQSQREVEIAAAERERQWKLQLADFVFRNHETIFSPSGVEREHIINVIAVTFPPNLVEVLFDNLKALPTEDKGQLDDGSRLLRSLQRMSSDEVGIDRFGSDYKDFRVADLAECREACLKEIECKAFSFNLSAGVNQCWLKNAVPLRRENASFVSGVKVGY